MTRLLLFLLALFGMAVAAATQDRAEMNRPVAPFRIAGTSIMSAPPASPPTW